MNNSLRDGLVGMFLAGLGWIFISYVVEGSVDWSGAAIFGTVFIIVWFFLGYLFD